LQLLISKSLEHYFIINNHSDEKELLLNTS